MAHHVFNMFPLLKCQLRENTGKLTLCLTSVSSILHDSSNLLVWFVLLAILPDQLCCREFMKDVTCQTYLSFNNFLNVILKSPVAMFACLNIDLSKWDMSIQPTAKGNRKNCSILELTLLISLKWILIFDRHQPPKMVFEDSPGTKLAQSDILD